MEKIIKENPEWVAVYNHISDLKDIRYRVYLNSLRVKEFLRKRYVQEKKTTV